MRDLVSPWPDPNEHIEITLGNFRATCNCGWKGPLRETSTEADNDLAQGHQHTRLWSLDLRPKP